MIIGAGSAGQVLTRELLESHWLNTKVCCVIDDNPYKKGKMLNGISIEGDRYDIPYLVKKYHIDRIIYAIPSSKVQDRKEILNICKECGCKLQTVPAFISWSTKKSASVSFGMWRLPICWEESSLRSIMRKSCR